jgi:hypothetical protein
MIEEYCYNNGNCIIIIRLDSRKQSNLYWIILRGMSVPRTITATKVRARPAMVTAVHGGFALSHRQTCCGGPQRGL